MKEQSNKEHYPVELHSEWPTPESKLQELNEMLQIWKGQTVHFDGLNKKGHVLSKKKTNEELLPFLQVNDPRKYENHEFVLGVPKETLEEVARKAERNAKELINHFGQEDGSKSA